MHVRVQANTVITGNDQIFSPGYIIIDRDTGRITDIGEGVLKESEDDDIVNVDVVLPGFVDIHNHGFGGSEDVLDYWTKPEYTLSRLPKMGVTACLATVTLPASESLLRRSLEACRVISKTIETCPTKFGAGIYGIHAEGPIIATYGGLPNSDAISKWTITNFRKLLDNIGKYLRIMTISPSLETGSYVHKKSQDEEKEEKHFCLTCSPILECTSSSTSSLNVCICAESFKPFERLNVLLKRGIVPGLGHDKKASLKDILACLECQKYLPEDEFVSRKDDLSVRQPLRGPLHVTHAFNVMSFHHRDIGLANLAMIREFPAMYKNLQVPTVEVIGDTRHVSPIALQGLFDARGVSVDTSKDSEFVGKNSVALVSDAIAGFDTSVGTKLKYGGSREAFVRVGDDGKTKCVVDERGVLCGSCESLGETFLRLVNEFEMSLHAASRLCSLNPARIARLSHLIGSLEVGKRGDLVFIDRGDSEKKMNEKFRIAGCVVGGVVLHHITSRPPHHYS